MASEEAEALCIVDAASKEADLPGTAGTVLKKEDEQGTAKAVHKEAEVPRIKHWPHTAWSRIRCSTQAISKILIVEITFQLPH